MLTSYQVGDDQASSTYIRNKMKAIKEAGLEARHIHLPEETTTANLVREITSDTSRAILVQLPLPKHIDKEIVLAVMQPDQDIDGLHPKSDYKPLTPCAIMRWLKEKGVDLVGKNVTILGRSELVGKPLANMMIDAGATVAVCNSHTNPGMTQAMCLRSHIVISAVGKLSTVTCDHVASFRKQIFIDVGINRDDHDKLCGDISPDAKRLIVERGSEYTPVPGGVGRWTVRELVLRLKEMEGIFE